MNKKHWPASALMTASIVVAGCGSFAANAEIPEGVYQIKSKKSGLCLDVWSGSTQQAARIVQWQCHDGNNQRWKITPAGGGSYRLLAMHSGLAMDVESASTANGAGLQQWPDNGSGAQRFKFEDLGNNEFRIINSGSGKSLDIEEASVEPGVRLQQWDWNSGDHQRFYLMTDGGPTPPGASIPGKIEAEDYSAFSDTTSGNTGGGYRQDDVDIEATADQDGGFNVGWTAPGEYLRYNLNAGESGDYKVTLRVASIYAGKQVVVKLDGADVSGALAVPNTGGWQNWADISFNANLSSGAHQLEVAFLTDGINLNYINFAKGGDPTDPTDPPGWTLVWRDEFNGDSIDLGKWEHEVNGNGGGNNELQYYTARSQNSWVSGGKLHIQALKERYTGPEGTRDYTSARLRTLNKGDWKYGRFEIRAKLPWGQGMWPAIWMLPTDWVYGGWAASGEIDIMEAVNLKGAGGNEIYGTLHYGGEWPNNTHTGDHMAPSSSVVDQFHTYALEWEENEIRWYIDGVHYQTQTDWYSTAAPYPAPYNQRFHMILNLAVGGNWPGNPNGSTVFPQSMEVDYVRVYRKN
ncbi:RICIN domain-containing protein [Hahella sp. CR1]|uniref:RICIN domain-containing protein n=1 Tax=Hahella sp. CR1 TaxID=2992807 RepID=UPI0024414450|nr:RICIN domain-containing protein [Hahella sp. CR1]MDG9668684.1 RICIN domain-containing protein [Hahella sp. CR1]